MQFATKLLPNGTSGDKGLIRGGSALLQQTSIVAPYLQRRNPQEEANCNPLVNSRVLWVTPIDS